MCSWHRRGRENLHRSKVMLDDWIKASLNMQLGSQNTQHVLTLLMEAKFPHGCGLLQHHPKVTAQLRQSRLNIRES